MKCLACDAILTDREATRKSATTSEFIDLCDDCFEPIKEEVPVIENTGNNSSFDNDIDQNGEDADAAKSGF